MIVILERCPTQMMSRFLFKMTSKGEIFCNLQLFSLFFQRSMEKKNPSVWQFEHFSEVSGRKSDGLRSPGPLAFGENLRDSAPASKRGNQFFLDRILVKEQSQIKISIWSLANSLSGTQVWVSSLCGASFFHRLGVPDCRRTAWPNQFV